MNETIAIATDFRVDSLVTLQQAMMRESAPVKVILICGIELSGSISQLLFNSPERTIRNLKNPEFTEFLSVISNRYESMITELVIKPFYGVNSNAARAFVSANNIDRVYAASDYRLQPPVNGFDPTTLFTGSGVPVVQVPVASSEGSVYQQLSALLNRNRQYKPG
ncbi:MAG: hypothetical protein V4616_00320 [Bacteroidota bacterium]